MPQSMRSISVSLVTALLLGSALAGSAQDGGAPMERAGDALKPPGQGSAAFTPEQAKVAVNDFIQAKLREGSGVYRLTDDKTGEKLDLEFVDIAIVSVERLWRIHDPTRRVEGSGYFACTSFRPVGPDKEKLYDIDVWLSPREGKLEVTAVLIHKEPRWVGGKWVKVPRYTVGR